MNTHTSITSQTERASPSNSAISKSGIRLIPSPTNDPEDPLNWRSARKLRILAVLCLAAFTANVSALSGQLAYPHQAAVYGKTILESSYSVSAAIAGLAAGALIFVPLAQIFGRSSLTLWSLLCSLACAIWSSRMTKRDDYVPFIISRLMSGMFGSVPSAVGGGTILDIFFLHDRGKAFICFEVSILLGATVGPTFSGFISNSQSWTVCFWWTVPLLAVSTIAVLLLAEETSYDRKYNDADVKMPQRPRRYIANRVATFFPGTAIIAKPSAAEFARSAAAPFQIGFSPATVLVGVFTLVIFGWVLLNDVLSPTFLQTPVDQGGYGFTPIQNGAFTFSSWLAIFAAQVVGLFTNDNIPLWICKRYHGGIWKPELRLYCTSITVVVVPIGLGICGAGLQYHLHYMVYALGVFLVGMGTLISIPIATNYVAESFTHYGTESTLVMTFYRLSWGISIPFFIDSWIAKVQLGWVFGMAAFLTIAAWLLVLLLLWKGQTFRRWNFMRSLASSEEGATVFEA